MSTNGWVGSGCRGRTKTGTETENDTEYEREYETEREMEMEMKKGKDILPTVTTEHTPSRGSEQDVLTLSLGWFV